MALPSKLSSGKHYSLFVRGISDEQNNLYDIVTWSQCYKDILVIISVPLEK
jgi:hypothetical protein